MTQPLHSLESMPESGFPMAALFLLHGINSNELDLLPLAAGLGDSLHAVSLRAPMDAGPNRYLWYPLLSGGPAIDYPAALSARDRLAAHIESYKQRHPERPVYLAGFSQGAALSLVTALTLPGLADGAICFSGRFPLEFAGLLPDDEAKPASTEIWVSHGRADTAIPIALGRDVQALLRQLGVLHVYTEYEAAHQILPSMVTDARRWLAGRLASAEEKAPALAR